MALGTITASNTQVPGQPGSPVYVVPLSFLGDDAYPTGGTTGFEALVNAAAGVSPKSLTIVGVFAGDCGGFLPVFEGGALKVYEGTAGANAEVANATDLSATTFNVVVVAK